MYENQQRNYVMYLQDMLTSIERIAEYLNGFEFINFTQNYLVVDTVCRNFEIIGEAAKNIPKEIQQKYPEMPWRKMYGLRNLISHEYFGIDYEIIWEIATKNLPQNNLLLAKIIEDES